MPKNTFRVVTRGNDGSIRIRDYDTHEPLLKMHTQVGIDDSSTDLALRGLPVFRGLIGPMPEEKGVVRYETPDVFESLTKEWAVTAAAIDIHATTTGDGDSNLIGIGVKEAFQKLLPARVLVQFIKKCHRDGAGQSIQSESINEFRRTCKDEFPVIDVIPVDIGVCVIPASGCFTDLSWSTDERHLPVSRKMFD